MWEHKVPRDVPTEIHGAIECVIVDQLRPMLEELEAAARVTAEELRERHRRQRRG